MKITSILPVFALLSLVQGSPSPFFKDRRSGNDAGTSQDCFCSLKNDAVGGLSLEEYSLYSNIPYDPVKTINTWSQHSNKWRTVVVFGIQVEWESGEKSALAGQALGDMASFSLGTGEKIATMELAAAAGVDRIAFTTTNGRSFKAGGPGGTAVQMNVGNGLLRGFEGSRNPQDLTSITTAFYADCEIDLVGELLNPQCCECSLLSTPSGNLPRICLGICL